MDADVMAILSRIRQVTAFVRQYAFAECDGLSPAEFIADQCLRRCTDLADDFCLLMDEGHELNATMLERGISDRVTWLAWLRERGRFKEFQDRSLSSEYRKLGQLGSTHNVPVGTLRAIQGRKRQIRVALGGRVRKPGCYLRMPRYEDAWQQTSGGHGNAAVVALAGYHFPSSAVHMRHNDAETTGIYPWVAANQVLSSYSGLVILALLIGGREDMLEIFWPVLASVGLGQSLPGDEESPVAG